MRGYYIKEKLAYRLSGREGAKYRIARLPIPSTYLKSAKTLSSPKTALKKAGAKITLLLLSLFLVIPQAVRGDTKIGVILSGNNPAYEKLANAFRESLLAGSERPVTIVLHTLDRGSREIPENLADSDIFLPVGTGATNRVLASGLKAKIIPTFITKNAAGKLFLKQPDSNSANNIQLAGGIYLDQPARRLLQLARLINPKVSQLGMLTGELSAARTEEFQNEAKAMSLSINSRKLQPQDNPVKSLEAIMSGSQAYIVLPDKTEFNRATAKWVIYLSYRYGIPVIGYSSRYVDAGALASVFSTPEQMGRQAAELVLRQLSGISDTNRFEYPKYYVVRINNKVKRSLGYNWLDEESLHKELMAKDQTRSQSSLHEGAETND